MNITIPSATEMYEESVNMNNSMMQLHLETIVSSIRKSAKSGKTSTSISASGIERALRIPLCTALIAEGYDAKMYYGDQRDPACQIDVSWNKANG